VLKKLKNLASELQVDLSGCFEKREIMQLLASSGRYFGSNDEIEVNDAFIRGTTVSKSTAQGSNPINIDHRYARERNGTSQAPFQACAMYKYTKRNKPKFRLIKPGKLTPLVDLGSYPYDPPKPPQLTRLPNGKYRHIGSFSLKELRQIGWDGAMYNSQFVETWVPLVDGYDSDENDKYEPFNQRKARESGIIGLPIQDIGKYMYIPNPSNPNGGPLLVQLKK